MRRYPEQFLAALCAAIRQRTASSRPIMVGVDGPGCSGKSGLSDELVDALAGQAVALGLDSFFVPLGQQTLVWDWSEDISDGVPHLRWAQIETAVQTLGRGKSISLRPYLWEEDALGAKESVEPAPIVIVEGLYALHPRLRMGYDVSIWVDSRRDDRMTRVRARTARTDLHHARLLRLWDELYVPREHMYIARFRPHEIADLFVFGAGLDPPSTHRTFAWQLGGSKA
jgi:uridine kinase